MYYTIYVSTLGCKMTIFTVFVCRYKKTIGSKDLSKKSDKEISCVLGKRRKFTKYKVCTFDLVQMILSNFN